MNKKTIVSILAVIGGLVVLGWVLRLTFALLGPIVVIGLGVVAYFALTGNKRIGGGK
ncbi:hypothetical protein [Sphingomonas sp.]|uniref:hypothetical protein n=1 Tax=Sphingomonas sp. TaxID=28214 RepID=UPI001D46B6A0|nr:hypothetical protein [Sphingomonas sp.]MBX9796165.1 hypothetical protein [Sphingomonas sp.]